jgi:mono/diheme cytochrome c family protein
MIKRIVLSVLAVIVVMAAAGLGYLYLRKPAQASPSDIRVQATPERLARGKYIFENLAACGDCHSQRDMTRFGGPIVVEGQGRGNVLSDWLKGLPGTVVAPNITPDPETGIGKWTDGEKIRAIREGVDKDGRALFPMMPYQGFREMSDDDVQALVAYLDALPPLRNPLPATALKFPVNLMIKGVPQPAGSVPPLDPSNRVHYGERLAAIAGCGDCHTPQSHGQPVEEKRFAGGQRFESTMGTVVSANITPDLETGIGKWDEAFFLKKIYDYKDYAEHGSPKMSGPEQFTVMPWLSFARLTPEDLGAIYAYLRTVKPVRNYVEKHPNRPATVSERRSPGHVHSAS